MLLVIGMDVVENISKGIKYDIKSLHLFLLNTCTTKVTTVVTRIQKQRSS